MGGSVVVAFNAFVEDGMGADVVGGMMLVVLMVEEEEELV